MTESLAAVGAFERFLTGVNPYVFLEVVLELERFRALRTLELSQFRALLVADLVALKAVDVGEGFVAHLALLRSERRV